MADDSDNQGASTEVETDQTQATAEAPSPEAPDAPDEAAWAASQTLGILAGVADPERVRDGAELARLNRVVRLDIEPGRINASVRDRSSRPERVTITVGTHPHEVWDGMIARAADAPSIAARMLSGTIPREIESLMPPGDDRAPALFPSPDELHPGCRCQDPEPWCRHACAALAALAARMRDEPFLIFALRGLPEDEVIERLRQRRAIQGRTIGEAPAYAQRPVLEGDAASRPLEMVADSFWEAGPELDTLDTSLRKPEISCPLLRRLGPSPFEQAKFPLLGLLATCYEVIGDAALAGGDAPEGEDAGEGPEGGENAEPDAD